MHDIARWVTRAYALSVQHKRDSGCSCVTYLHTYIHIYIRVHCYALIYYWKLTGWITDIYIYILYLQLKCIGYLLYSYVNKMSTLDPDTISTPPNSPTHTAYLC